VSIKKKCRICGKIFSGEGDIGPTCEEHAGEIGKYYIKMAGVPNDDDYISLVELYNEAQRLGKSRVWAVRLTGGDAGVKPPMFPEFTIYKFGKRKYCRSIALQTLREIAGK